MPKLSPLGTFGAQTETVTTAGALSAMRLIAPAESYLWVESTDVSAFTDVTYKANGEPIIEVFNRTEESDGRYRPGRNVRKGSNRATRADRVMLRSAPAR
jgi:hypothetical protein